MGKCLITKFNESVNNDNLLKIGEFSISLNEIESPSESSQKIQKVHSLEIVKLEM